MNEAGRMLVLLAALLSLVVGTAGSTVSEFGGASADDEAAFVEMINGLRTELGLPILEVHPELTAEARAWSQVMAAGNQLAHADDITRNVTARWTTLGENVGVHRQHGIEELFEAFVASPTHYDNLTDPRYRYIGVGVEYSADDVLWTTHRFMATVDDVNLVEPQTSETGPGQPRPPHYPVLIRGTQLIG